MTDFLWELQGATPTEIAETDIIRFAGATFSDPVLVGDYNDSIHVKSSVGVDLSAANTPNNNKFISQAGGTGGKSQVAINGGAAQDLDTVVDAEAAIHVETTDVAAVVMSDGIFYSYNGVTPSVATAGLTVKAAEVGNPNFTDAEGNGSPLALGDQGSATVHDYYLIVSKSPSTPGLKSDKLRIELVVT